LIWGKKKKEERKSRGREKGREASSSATLSLHQGRTKGEKKKERSGKGGEKSGASLRSAAWKRGKGTKRERPEERKKRMAAVPVDLILLRCISRKKKMKGAKEKGRIDHRLLSSSSSWKRRGGRRERAGREGKQYDQHSIEGRRGSQKDLWMEKENAIIFSLFSSPKSKKEEVWGGGGKADSLFLKEER